MKYFFWTLLLPFFLTLYASCFTLPVYADASSASQSGSTLYRSEASVDIAVGNPQQNITANNNNCNGFYKSDFAKNTVWSANFGDPNCEFSTNTPGVINAAALDAVRSYLKHVDPSHANSWFSMMRIESDYDPNAWAPPIGDPKGAWGLLQMGSSTPPGKSISPSNGGENGEFDRGDVYWKQQIIDACQHILITGNHNSCDYFGSARQLGTCFTVSSCNTP